MLSKLPHRLLGRSTSRRQAFDRATLTDLSTTLSESDDEEKAKLQVRAGRRKMKIPEAYSPDAR